MDNQNNVKNATNETVVVEKKKFNSFIIYAVIAGLIAACILLGPIVFIILGTATDIGSNGKIINPLETQYILSVCIVTLIVCGLSLILIVSSLIYNIFNKNKKVVA